MGVDIYSGDGDNIDYQAVAAAGHGFAFCKASEGLYERDPNLAKNLAGFRAAGLVVGAYHYIHLSMDPAQQADHYLNTIRDAGFNFKTDVAILDLEDSAFAEEHGADAVIAHVAPFVQAIDRALGKRTTIYLSLSYANDYVHDAFSGHPLYLAYYNPEIKLPDGWSTWSVWQWTEHGTCPGIPNAGQTDLNHFNGDTERLRAWAAGN